MKQIDGKIEKQKYINNNPVYYIRWSKYVVVVVYLIGWVVGNSVIAISLAALYATREFSAASLRSLLVANSARYR